MMHLKIPPRHSFADRPSIDGHAGVMIAARKNMRQRGSIDENHTEAAD
jgi:hypothetical protein